MHSKGKHPENYKTTYSMGENICKLYDWQNVEIQNIKIAYTTQYQKNKQSNQKMGKRPE